MKIDGRVPVELGLVAELAKMAAALVSWILKNGDKILRV